jgi:hypothetical protein
MRRPWCRLSSRSGPRPTPPDQRLRARCACCGTLRARSRRACRCPWPAGRQVLPRAPEGGRSEQSQPSHHERSRRHAPTGRQPRRRSSVGDRVRRRAQPRGLLDRRLRRGRDGSDRRLVVIHHRPTRPRPAAPARGSGPGSCSPPGGPAEQIVGASFRHVASPQVGCNRPGGAVAPCHPGGPVRALTPLPNQREELSVPPAPLLARLPAPLLR